MLSQQFSSIHSKKSSFCSSLLRSGWMMALLLCLTFMLPVSAQNSKKIKKMKAQRTEMKKQIGEMENLLNTTRNDVASQLQNLSVLDAQITERQKYIENMQAEADSLAIEIDTLESQLQGLQKDLNICKENYRRAMSYVARNRHQRSRWMFVLMANDFRQMYRRLRYVSQYSKYQRAQGEIIKGKETVVKKKQEELLQVKAGKEQLLAEGRNEQLQLENKKKERQSVVESLSKKQKQLQQQLKKEKKKYQDLNNRIDRLIQEEIAAAERRRQEAERKRKAEEARRKKAAGKKSGGNSNTGKPTAAPQFQAPDDADRQLNSNFAANKGRLPVPITGHYAVTSRFGKYNVEGLRGVTLDNKGVNLTGRPGAQARAIFNGEVCSVVNIGGTYAVIIRHGSYFSVYSNLSSVSVRQGQKITTRQIIGNISTDKTGNCTLHFQLRKSTQKLNPLQWIGK